MLRLPLGLPPSRGGQSGPFGHWAARALETHGGWGRCFSNEQPLIPYEMGDDGMELKQKMWVSDGFNLTWAVSHF